MRSKFSYIFFIILLAYVGPQFSLYAQHGDIQSNAKNDRLRVSSNNGEFSVELPSSVEYFYDIDGFEYESPGQGMFRFREMQMLNAVSGRTYMCVEMYRVVDPKAYIEHLIKSGGLSAQKININSTVQIKRVTPGPSMPAKLKNRVNFDARYIASETHVYIVTVWNRGGNNSIADSFISSIRLGPIQTVDDLRATGKVPTVKPESLQAKTIRDIAGQLSKDERRLVAKNPKWDIEDPDSLIVLYRPWSGSVQPINNMLSKGKVSLKVTYGENGWITNVQHISGLTGNQSRNAFFSVLRSKFLPKEQDGKPISSDRKLDFQF